MFKFENLFKNKKESVKRATKIGALATGLGASLVLGSPEATAQNTSSGQEIKKETKFSAENDFAKQIELDRQYLASPQRYDLSKKHDLSGSKKARQINHEELLKYNIETIKNRLKQTQNWIFLKMTPTGADIVEPTGEDTKNQSALIKEYEDYLLNPSLDVKKVGDVEFDQEDFELNKRAFEFYSQRIEKMAEHIKSPEYLKKLMVEYNVDETEAKKHQETRLANLYNGEYSLTDKDPDFTSDEHSFETRLYKDTTKTGFSAEHELLGHKIVDGNFISKRANKLLLLSYQKFDPQSPYFKDLIKAEKEEDVNDMVRILDNYFGSKGERFAYKQELEAEMATLGVKKYGEKFTPEHYKKLMELYHQGKLSKGSCRFIETTKAEYLERIFNEIASLGKDGKTFYNPQWNYEQPENLDNKV